MTVSLIQKLSENQVVAKMLTIFNGLFVFSAKQLAGMKASPAKAGVGGLAE